MVLVVLALVSGLSFLHYGFKVLFRTASRGEFERYGVPAMRRLVDVLEVLGGTAVMLGLSFMEVRPSGRRRGITEPSTHPMSADPAVTRLRQR